MKEKKNIVIIGAGWGGLSAAHLLSKNKGLNITIIEKEKNIGGQATSEFKNLCYVEYSWRVYFDRYYNLKNILQEIGIPCSLTPLGDSCISYKGKCIKFSDFQNMTLYSMLRTFNIKLKTIIKIIYLYLLPEKTIYNRYKNTRFVDYVGENPFLLMLAGPILGLEAKKVSVPTIYSLTNRFFSMGKKINIKDNKWKVTTGPPNVSIFDKWKPYLEKQGVKFKVNTSCKKVDPENNIVYTDKETYNADQIIVSCSLSSAVKITKSLSTKSKSIKNLEKLYPCFQNYFSINFYFSEKLGEIYNHILIDQPWQPIIQAKRTKKWTLLINKECKDNIEDVWAVAVIDNFQGKHIKKKLKNCSIKEVIEETTYQLKTDKYIKSLRSCSGKSFEDLIIGTEIYHYWKNKNGKIFTPNPKFSYNAGYTDYLIETSPEDVPPNLHFGAYYCNNGYYDGTGVSMECSCKNGLLAGRDVLKSLGMKETMKIY